MSKDDDLIAKAAALAPKEEGKEEGEDSPWRSPTTSTTETANLYLAVSYQAYTPPAPPRSKRSPLNWPQPNTRPADLPKLKKLNSTRNTSKNCRKL
jgi:hypothetical protein